MLRSAFPSQSKQNPNMHLKIHFWQTVLVLPFLFLSTFAFSQVEDCNNGIDDDGDGLIDCFDTDCTCTGQCDDFYYTTCNADCYYIPPCGQITLGIQWASDAETGTYSPLVAGDMDGDGIPDVVTTKVESPDLYIIDGATGLTKVHVIAPTNFPGGTAPAIADLDHDGFGEVVIVGFDRILYCYEHDGTLKYTSTIQVGYHPRYRFAIPNIADFDHDGWAEVNIGNQVFNGQTGALLAEGGMNVSAGEHPARVITGLSFASPVPMDVLPDNFCPDCAGLEIVAGNQVLSVNLTTGAVTPVVTADVPMTDGFTSIADFDRDGDLDAIVQGRNSLNNWNTIFVWDLQTPTILRQFQLQNNWQEGASRVNIADLDGDGQLEASFVSYPSLYALDNDFSILWTRMINDASSITCSSIFDFCGDGSADIVYRDQDFLRVIDGATGQVSFQDNCLSATHIEAPLILDVDADGQTEIVIQCGTNGGTITGTVYAYEAIGTPGISSRKVWNQHAYFNTNINEDLSVPRFQQNPSIIGDSLVLNTFLNQYFNPTFPSPDAAISFQNVACEMDSLLVSIEVCNVGDNVLPPQTPVSAYMGNPLTSAATWLAAVPIGVLIGLGECDTFTFKIPRVANDSVFLVLNDDHSLLPPFDLATDFPVTSIGECGFLNNMAAFYYAYMPGTVNLGIDTAICDNTSLMLDASGNDFTNWMWSTGEISQNIDAQGPGNYSVDVTDICQITHSDTIVITIDSSTVVNIGLDQELCQGETVSFSASGFDFYNWSSPGSLDCNNCPDVVLTPNGSTFVALEAGFANGCMNMDTAFVAVYDTFYQVVDTSSCLGQFVNWNGQMIEPETSVTFSLQTIHGCDSTIVVKVSPLDTFYLQEDRQICFGETSDVFGVAQSMAGIYIGKFLSGEGCDSTHEITLHVYPQIELEIDTENACFGEATGTLSANVPNGVDPLQFAWDFSASTSPIQHNLTAGNYSLTVTDGNDCTETQDVAVESYPAYTFDAFADSVSCFGLNDGSINIQSPDTTLTYSIDGGAFMQTTAYENLMAATYEIIAEDIYGCQDTVSVNVLEPPLLAVGLPFDTSIQLGVSVPLNIALSGLPPVSWTWSDTSYLSCLNCTDPIAIKPLETIRYVLTIVDENGCVASDDMLITIDPTVNVYIPNAMGVSDGNNRFIISFGPAVQKVNYLRIFDRWGSLLHDVSNAFPGDASLEWDGRHNGALVNPGVFVWIMELELVDGTVLQKKGDLTVIR